MIVKNRAITSGLFISTAFAALALLGGCASKVESPSTKQAQAHTQRAPVDPSDSALITAIHDYLDTIQGPRNSRYEYVRMDLNNDGLREGIVLFNLPHSYWCGWSGCTMAIFEAGDDHFALRSETKRIRGPLVVNGTQTNGWKDIAMRLSGTEMADRNVVLRFNGQSYPDNPLMAEEMLYDLAYLQGTRIFP